MTQRILAAAGFALLSWLPISAYAQSSPVVLSGGCGTATYSHNPPYFTIDTTGKLCVNASVSASITGFPTTQSTGTPIAVTTGGVTGTLPAGTVVVASNVGATNGAFCKLGASATTSDQLIPPNSWFAFTVGAATQLTCITSTSTTTVNMVGGSGLPTGSGGGGGGSGGGGAVTVANGADTAEGSTTDAVAATPASGTAATVVALLKAVNNNVAAAIAAGTNFIGQVGAWVTPTSYLSGTTAAMTGTTSTQLLAAVAAKKIYVLSISCVNSHATVGTFVTVQDGSGGTALATLAAAAVFGGDEKTSVGPLFSTTSGNGLFVADVTTGANVICNASGFAQ